MSKENTSKKGEMIVTKTVTFRLNDKEKIVLTKMMNDGDWTNVSGFIKYQLFGENLSRNYDKILVENKSSDMQKTLQILLDSIGFSLAKIASVFKEEIGKIEKKQDKKLKQTNGLILAKMIKLYENFEALSGTLMSTAEKMIIKQGLNVKSYPLDDVRYKSDEELEQMSNTWDTADSPASQELIRRKLLREEKDE